MSEKGSIADIGYRIVLTPHYEMSDDMTSEEKAYISSLNESIEFDYVNSSSITSNADLTTYPLVNGDTVSDHMQITPKSIRVSGTFSLNGNRPSSFINYSNDRLTNIQTFFEKLQSDAVFCSLTTLSRNENNKQRFVSRDSLVLQNITWTESQNSLGFDFTFTEVQTVDVKQPTPTPDDSNSPSIYTPSTLSFTEYYNVVDGLLEWCVQTLLDAGCITPSFVIYAVEYGKNMNYETYLSDSFYNQIYATLPSTAQDAVSLDINYNRISGNTYHLSTSAGKVGDKYLSGNVISYWFTWWCQDIFDGNSFPHFYLVSGNNEQNNSYAKDFLDFLGEIYAFIESLNEYIKVYGISVNSEQILITSINNTYYQFEFVENNTDGCWSLNIYDQLDNIVATYSDISNKAISNFSAVTTNNSLINDTIKDNVWVYLVNSRLMTATGADIDERLRQITGDLKNYQIIVSTINLIDFKETYKESLRKFMETQ